MSQEGGQLKARGVVVHRHKQASMLVTHTKKRDGWMGVQELNRLGNKGCSPPLCPASCAAEPASRGEPLKHWKQSVGGFLMDPACCPQCLLQSLHTQRKVLWPEVQWFLSRLWLCSAGVSCSADLWSGTGRAPSTCWKRLPPSLWSLCWTPGLIYHTTPQSHASTELWWCERPESRDKSRWQFGWVDRQSSV